MMDLNIRLVARHLGYLLLVISALIVGVGGFALIDEIRAGFDQAGDLWALLLSGAIGAIAGAALRASGRGLRLLQLGQREALLLVALSWIVGAALGALPFWMWAHFRGDAAAVAHPFDSVVDCYFESMSGFTTTGATVVTKLASLPRSLLLWRSVTHWLGGLGIVVLYVAVLPSLGVGGRRVYFIEATGKTREGLRPRIQDTARTLWFIYLGLTLAEIIALLLCGMGPFDAVCHTFATLATGGFSTHDASVAAFDSTAIHLVVIVFMLAAGVNFALYQQLIRGDWRRVGRDPELRAYLGVVAVATVIVAASLWRQNLAAPPQAPPVSEHVVRDALFQVVSIQTTTGFVTRDFDLWGFSAEFTLLVLMFVGASAGSTGGGIKVMRIIIAAKVLIAEIEHVFRPKVVRTLKVGTATIDAALRQSTLAYILGIALLFTLGTVALMLLEGPGRIDITTAASASAATLNNIGPGFGEVGATKNYAWFSDASKLVMCVLMALGRLEVFTIVVLFAPGFWKSE